MLTPVYLVHCFSDHRPPLALGLVAASIKAASAVCARLDFAPGYIGSAQQLLSSLAQHGPGIVFFSDYIWNVTAHLDVSRRIREQVAPDSFIVHGGPSVPRDPRTNMDFLLANPAVDVTCLGEGEATCPDLLAEYFGEQQYERVGGAAFLRNGQYFAGPPRERRRNLDEFPSAYLTGEFDDLLCTKQIALIETNRGCPYGCTFCDWGQATLQRVHSFSLNRVRAELEYVAQRGISAVELTDANFGIFDRDIDIIRHVATLKQRYGVPKQFYANNAKNATSRVSEIVRIARDADLIAQGTLSVQTYDEGALAAVHRRNIRPSRYDELLQEFRAQGLPVQTEIMMGLPGSTYASFARDLQWACDRDLCAHVSWTVMLPNTPMADPTYREKYAIVLADESRFGDFVYLRSVGMKPLPPTTVVATSTFTEEDFLRMSRLSSLFHLFQGESLLKYLMSFLHRSRGISNVSFLEGFACADLAPYPRLKCLRDWKLSFDRTSDPLWETVRTCAWPELYREVRAYLEDAHDLRSDDVLEDVCQLQEFVMAYSGRSTPDALSLRHDFVAYFRDIVASQTNADLASYGSGQLTVTDPAGICDRQDKTMPFQSHSGTLELRSPLTAATMHSDVRRSLTLAPRQRRLTLL